MYGFIEFIIIVVTLRSSTVNIECKVKPSLSGAPWVTITWVVFNLGYLGGNRR